MEHNWYWTHFELGRLLIPELLSRFKSQLNYLRMFCYANASASSFLCIKRNILIYHKLVIRPLILRKLFTPFFPENFWFFFSFFFQIEIVSSSFFYIVFFFVKVGLFLKIFIFLKGRWTCCSWMLDYFW